MSNKPVSINLQAAEAIGAMVQKGTRSTGKSLYKKPKPKGKEKETSKDVSKDAQKAIKPTAKPNKPKSTVKPTVRPTAKPASSAKTKKIDVTKEPVTNIYRPGKTPAVDLSFDKPEKFKITDKRVK